MAHEIQLFSTGRGMAWPGLAGLARARRGLGANGAIFGIEARLG